MYIFSAFSPFFKVSFKNLMLSKVFTLQQPVRHTARLYSSTSTHFLKDFMTTKEKGPVQLSIENKVRKNSNFDISNGLEPDICSIT